MRFQSIYRTDVDYDKTLDILQSSKDVKSGHQGETGIVSFCLKNFPDVTLQLSPKGKINVYHNLLEELHNVLTTLKRILITEQGKTPQFALLKIIPSQKELMEWLKGEPFNPIRSLNIKFLAPLIENGWIADE